MADRGWPVCLDTRSLDRIEGLSFEWKRSYLGGTQCGCPQWRPHLRPVRFDRLLKGALSKMERLVQLTISGWVMTS